jgi:hypothetical protein
MEVRMDHEHDDDLAPSVDQRGDVEVEDFPESAVSSTGDDEIENDPSDDELPDEDVVGK